MIEDLQKKSDDLLSNAEKMALKLAEEARQRDIANNVRRLVHKKLEYKTKDAVKRQNSWKGTTRPLFAGGDQEDWQKALEEELERPHSRKLARDKMVRPIQRE